MKHPSFLQPLLCLLCAFFSGCAGQVTPYEERVVTEYYDHKDFSKIIINTPLKTTIVAGEFYEVSLLTKRWEQNNYRVTKIFDDVLSVRFEVDETETRFSGAELMIRLPVLRGLTLRTAGEITVSGLTGRDTPIIFLSDGAELELAGGWVNQVQISAGHDALVDGISLRANRAEIYSVSNRDVSITAVDELKGRLEGAGNLRYRGRPDIAVALTGTGQVVDLN